jgi:hypothetical protein
MSFLREINDFLILVPPMRNHRFSLMKSMISLLPSLLNEIGDIL